jgi:hypothetical protein
MADSALSFGRLRPSGPAADAKVREHQKHKIAGTARFYSHHLRRLRPLDLLHSHLSAALSTAIVV